jgi:hypothetical protein
VNAVSAHAAEPWAGRHAPGVMARALFGFAGGQLKGGREESGLAEDVQSDAVLVEQIAGKVSGRLGQRVNAWLTRSASALTAFLRRARGARRLPPVAG